MASRASVATLFSCSSASMSLGAIERARVVASIGGLVLIFYFPVKRGGRGAVLFSALFLAPTLDINILGLPERSG